MSTDPTPDDAELLSRVALGDEPALELLMERHQPAVYSLAFRYTRNPTDAAELAEETFVRVFFHAASYRSRPGIKPLSWILRITANLCTDWQRRQTRRKTVSFDGSQSVEDFHDLSQTFASNEPDPAAQTQQREMIARLEELVAELPDNLRLPFIMVALEDLSYQDCADALKISPKAVETRLYRARQQLKAHFPDR